MPEPPRVLSRRLRLWAAVVLTTALTAALLIFYLNVHQRLRLEAAVTRPPTLRPPDIYAAPTEALYRRGSAGPEVLRLQQRLLDLGYYSGPVDGDFGSATQQAVQRFQVYHGLVADGMAGSDTLKALYSEAARPLSPQSPLPPFP